MLGLVPQIIHISFLFFIPYKVEAVSKNVSFILEKRIAEKLNYFDFLQIVLMEKELILSTL